MSDGTWAGMREETQTEETALCVDTRNKVESKRKNEYMYIFLAHSESLSDLCHLEQNWSL